MKYKVGDRVRLTLVPATGIITEICVDVCSVSWARYLPDVNLKVSWLENNSHLIPDPNELLKEIL